jgi:hypothetical protein
MIVPRHRYKMDTIITVPVWRRRRGIRMLQLGLVVTGIGLGWWRWSPRLTPSSSFGPRPVVVIVVVAIVPVAVTVVVGVSVVGATPSVLPVAAVAPFVAAVVSISVVIVVAIAELVALLEAVPGTRRSFRVSKVRQKIKQMLNGDRGQLPDGLQVPLLRT